MIMNQEEVLGSDSPCSGSLPQRQDCLILAQPHRYQTPVESKAMGSFKIISQRLAHTGHSNTYMLKEGSKGIHQINSFYLSQLCWTFSHTPAPPCNTRTSPHVREVIFKFLHETWGAGEQRHGTISLFYLN